MGQRGGEGEADKSDKGHAGNMEIGGERQRKKHRKRNGRDGRVFMPKPRIMKTRCEPANC